MIERFMLKILLGYVYAEESKNHMGLGKYPDSFLYKIKIKIKYMLGQYVKRHYTKRNRGRQN